VVGRPLVRAFARGVIASRLLGPPVRHVRVRRGPLAGARLLVDLRDERWYWWGTYEPEVQSALVSHVRAGSVFYDLGAHAGFLAVLAQRLAGPSGFVLAAEANANLERRLAHNLTLNPGAPVEVVAAAVGDETGRGTLAPAANTYELRLAEANGGAKPQTEVTTVDALVTSGRADPDVIKIDVEGTELAVLTGAAKTIERKQPILICELHRWGRPLDVMSMLAEAGYELSSLPDGRPLTAAGVEIELSRLESTRILARGRRAPREQSRSAPR
jgi:FkbM family methyltransferase